MDVLTGFISLCGLFDFEHFESRLIAYILEMVFIRDVLNVNLKEGADFLKKYCALSYS